MSLADKLASIAKGGDIAPDTMTSAFYPRPRVFNDAIRLTENALLTREGIELIVGRVARSIQASQDDIVITFDNNASLSVSLDGNGTIFKILPPP